MNSTLEKLYKDGLSLKKISKNEQTLEMCKVAINQNPKALQYAARKCIDEAICLTAVKKDGNVFRYVPEKFKSEEMCLLAIGANVTLIDRVPSKWRTKELCLLAIQSKIETLKYAPHEMICEILNENGILLKQIPKNQQTAEMCNIAIKQNSKAMQYASKKYINEEICTEVLKNDINIIKYLPSSYKTKELCKRAILVDATLLNYVPDKYRTKELCLLAITNNPEAFQYIPDDLKYEVLNDESTIDLLNSIVNLNIEWLFYMPTSRNGIEVCLEHIKMDFSLSIYFSEEMKANHKILNYQKDKEKICVLSKFYHSEYHLFVAKVKVNYDERENIYEGLILDSYNTWAEFDKFDEFYAFLNGNLYDAELRSCKFKGVNLKGYNIQGAVIHHDVLIEQGLFDGSYYEELKGRFEELNIDEVEITDLSIPKEYKYPKPIDEDGYEEYDNAQIPFFYISDIHLCHRITNKFGMRATFEEVNAHVKSLVIEMLLSIGTIPNNSYILIAGDTSSDFNIAQIFYEELRRYWNPKNIIVIHGNHELWDPWDDMYKNVQFYRDYFNKLQITFLQNDILLVKNEQQLILSENEILKLNEVQLRELVLDCSIAVLGGIGFSGLNNKYNAKKLRYGKSFDELESNEDKMKRDIAEASRFNNIYRKLLMAIPNNKVIVLTHMPKWDWNGDLHNPNWIYVNGHNHNNYFDISNNKVVYADNQIGYYTERLGLKYFYVDNEYDIFTYLDDGIHELSKNQYVEFNKGKLVNMSYGKNDGQIYMIKKNGKYMFFNYCYYSIQSKKQSLYLLNGGKLKKLQLNRVEDLDYYYDTIDSYVENVNQLLDRYGGTQEKISKFIKGLGGSGKIHGCIVDVDKPKEFNTFSYCHLYVNPIDGSIIPYFAYDVKSRKVYKDFKAMIEAQMSCKLLKENYVRLEKNMNLNMPVLKYENNIEKLGDKTFIYDEGSYMYKISRIIKSLQYVTDKSIIRIWNEDLLNLKFINKIKGANSIDDMVNDTLILNIDD